MHVARSTTARARRLALAGLGLVSVALGLVGAVVPLLPTTPFVLLAAWCFARSSPRLNTWLHEHPLLGPPLDTWRRHRAVERGTKALALSAVWVTIPSSMYLVDAGWAKVGLGLVLLVATVALARLPTVDGRTEAAA